MKVTVNGYEIELVYTIGTTYMYEKLYNEPFDITTLNRQSVVMDYLYCNILTALKAKGYPMDFPMTKFIEWLDGQGGIKFLNEYAIYLSQQIEVQFNLKPQLEENETDNSHENHGNDSIKKKLKKARKSS